MNASKDILEYGSSFDGTMVTVTLVANTPKLFLPLDSQRWGFVINSSITGSVWFGLGPTVNNQVGLFLNSTQASILYINQDVLPGVPQLEWWIFSTVAGKVTAIISKTLPGQGTPFQSANTALRNLPAKGIVDSSFNRTGQVATPEQHIAALLRPSLTLPTIAQPTQEEMTNGKPIARKAKVRTIRRNL